MMRAGERVSSSEVICSGTMPIGKRREKGQARHKIYRHTDLTKNTWRRWQERNLSRHSNWWGTKKLQANWDFATAKDAKLRFGNLGGKGQQNCASWWGEGNWGGTREKWAEKGIKGAGCMQNRAGYQAGLADHCSLCCLPNQLFLKYLCSEPHACYWVRLEGATAPAPGASCWGCQFLNPPHSGFVWGTVNVHPLANSWQDQPLVRVNLRSRLQRCATEH